MIYCLIFFLKLKSDFENLERLSNNEINCLKAKNIESLQNEGVLKNVKPCLNNFRLVNGLLKIIYFNSFKSNSSLESQLASLVSEKNSWSNQNKNLLDQISQLQKQENFRVDHNKFELESERKNWQQKVFESEKALTDQFTRFEKQAKEMMNEKDLEIANLKRLTNLIQREADDNFRDNEILLETNKKLEANNSQYSELLLNNLRASFELEKQDIISRFKKEYDVALEKERNEYRSQASFYVQQQTTSIQLKFDLEKKQLMEQIVSVYWIKMLIRINNLRKIKRILICVYV